MQFYNSVFPKSKKEEIVTTMVKEISASVETGA